METTIIRYLHKNNRRNGLLMAKKIEELGVLNKTLEIGVFIGWSVCHTPEDLFDKKEALRLAEERIRKHLRKRVIPNKIHRDIQFFVERAKKYFKTDKIFIASSLYEVYRPLNADLCEISPVDEAAREFIKEHNKNRSKPEKVMTEEFVLVPRSYFEIEEPVASIS